MKTKKLTAILAFALAVAGSADASLITWSAALAPVEGGWGQTLSSGLFDTSGTFVSAENVGGAATTFDGISFAAGTTTFTGTFDGFHDSSQALSKTGTYGETGADTVTLSGLTVGYSYRVQALVYDGRGDTGIPGRTVEFDGINQGQYANGVWNVTWGPGLLVTGTFTADVVTQNFTIEAFAGTTSKGGQLNALTLYNTAIPEPGTISLAGLFAAGFLLRHRRKLTK